MIVDLGEYRRTRRRIDPEQYAKEIGDLCDEVHAGAIKSSLTLQEAVRTAELRTTSREK